MPTAKKKESPKEEKKKGSFNHGLFFNGVSGKVSFTNCLGSNIAAQWIKVYFCRLPNEATVQI